MNAMQKSVTLAGALALALTLGGCGSEGGNNCTEIHWARAARPRRRRRRRRRRCVIYGDNGPVPADSGGYIEFNIPSAGAVDATVDWTFASSDVWIAMTTGACDDLEAAFLGSCSTHREPPTAAGRSRRRFPAP